jgi:hypothetical protein
MYDLIFFYCFCELRSVSCLVNLEQLEVHTITLHCRILSESVSKPSRGNDRCYVTLWESVSKPPRLLNAVYNVKVID